MFSGNVFFRGDKSAAQAVLHEAVQLANAAEIKKVSIGASSYREQVTLSTGAVLDIVLGEYSTHITIVGSGLPVPGGEQEEEERLQIDESLFLLTPKAGYPTVVVYRTSDGVGMRAAGTMVSGNVYSQAANPANDDIMFSVGANNPAENFLEGSLFSEHGGAGVYSNGQLVINMNGTALGAAVVDGEMFVFVEDTGTEVKFWSHPVIKVPTDNPAAGFTVPLLLIADCLLVLTIPTATYSGAVPTNDPVGYTPCTFSDDGRKAVVASLLGTIRGNTHVSSARYPYVTTSEQDVYEITLYVTLGVLFAVEERKQKSYRRTIAKLSSSDFTMYQNATGAVFSVAVDAAGALVSGEFEVSAQELPGEVYPNCQLPGAAAPLATHSGVYTYKLPWADSDKELSANFNDPDYGGDHTWFNKYTVHIPKQVALREGLSMYEVYRRPYEVMVRMDTGLAPSICFPSDVRNKYNGDMLLQLETAAGRVNIPGLPTWTANFMDKSDSNSTNTYAEVDPGLSSDTSNTDTHYQSLGIPARSIDFHGAVLRQGNSLPHTRVKMCTHPDGFALYSTTNYWMLDRQSEVDLNVAVATVVLGLYDDNEVEDFPFTDLLAMYNDYLEATGSTLDKLPSTAIASALVDKDYMQAYGAVNVVPLI